MMLLWWILGHAIFLKIGIIRELRILKHMKFLKMQRFLKNQKYVLYCPVGMQSAVAAEKMQAKGYDVYSFRGGVNSIKNYIESSAN